MSATTTRERPILFSSPMVRAILDGRKTQTRRLVKPQPEKWIDRFGPSMNPLSWIPSGVFISDPTGVLGRGTLSVRQNAMPVRCPYGATGDELWVRETWADMRGTGIEHRPKPDAPAQRVAYAADCPAGSHGDAARKDFGIKWKPSIHMPRWACRITLEVVSVRVERVESISDADAIAEGIQSFTMQTSAGDRDLMGLPGWAEMFDRPCDAFLHLFYDLNKRSEPGTNPWVWVVEFKPTPDPPPRAGRS